MNVIEVDGLAKSYGDHHALTSVDLHVGPSEIVAVLGPNGAGKTTLVEICEGFRQRTSGTVSVLGVDPNNATHQWRSSIGMVLQETSLPAEARVNELLELFAGWYPTPRLIDEVISLVGLDDHRSHRVDQLSGGLQRRLDVGLAIIGRPKLIFLDEPTTGFDPEARRHFWSLISSLRSDGASVVLTTHYLDEAEALADRVAVIAGGRVVDVATPATLGGRDQRPAVVSWRADGIVHREATATPTQFVVSLSQRFHGEVDELTVTRPTLEDVYLDMIGEQS
jgi:ABC-2 type transport system ATP-binding protein